MRSDLPRHPPQDGTEANGLNSRVYSTTHERQRFSPDPARQRNSAATATWTPPCSVTSARCRRTRPAGGLRRRRGGEQRDRPRAGRGRLRGGGGAHADQPAERPVRPGQRPRHAHAGVASRRRTYRGRPRGLGRARPGPLRGRALGRGRLRAAGRHAVRRAALPGPGDGTTGGADRRARGSRASRPDQPADREVPQRGVLTAVRAGPRAQHRARGHDVAAAGLDHPTGGARPQDG